MYKSNGKSKFGNTNIADLAICHFISLNALSYASPHTNFVPSPVRLVSGVSIADRFSHIFFYKKTPSRWIRVRVFGFQGCSCRVSLVFSLVGVRLRPYSTRSLGIRLDLSPKLIYLGLFVVLCRLIFITLLLHLSYVFRMCRLQ